MKMRKFDSINVVPFIDVMLVLLVIVLTTATFIAKGAIPLDLPAGSSKENLPIKKIEISITKDGKFYLDTKEVNVDEIKERTAKLNRKDQIVIRTDKNSRFENFVKVIDVLKNNGIENISIVTVK